MPSEPDHPSRSVSGEFALITDVFAPLADNDWSLGLSDDAAVIAPPVGYDIVMTSDTLTADVHFRMEDGPESAACRALSTNVSDLAAMAAKPLGYTLAVAAPTPLDVDWFKAFAARLRVDQDRYAIVLLGGDTTSTPGPLSITISALGTVPHGQARHRSAALPDDDIWVTGHIGDACLGLMDLLSGVDELSSEARRFCQDRFLFPTARIEVTPLLTEWAHAAIDISDGLIADARHIAQTSGVGLSIEQALVPLSSGAQAVCTSEPALWQRLVSGGDDYEILFTAPQDARGALYAMSDEAKLKLPLLTRIGEVTAGPTGVVTFIDTEGEAIRINGSAGFDHFAAL